MSVQGRAKTLVDEAVGLNSATRPDH